MEVRIESMICVWDDAIPTMFLEFVNLLTLTTSEGELRKSVKEFAEKHELDKFFLYGFGSHHFYLHQRYMEKPNKFDPFGQKESAHLIYHTIAPLKVLVMGVNFILPF
ncbi:hypothetical protein M097_0613 [Phocaeicola vulgatus str. 3775 SL(B) 10 (iv)]|uniref:Uncharacterized protein n=4 Tax=Bacteroidales TaxID=171549 RepID=A0A078RDF0_PHOVU|nr:hypothetical protein M097_0613 [Phocaeicola vulgatus str. 3775 SL(B) 10 (iv)]KDS40913.1 hypothetical protein M098_3256 [Phocaeicola vulgatus str. 3775 SR(B) 19]